MPRNSVSRLRFGRSQLLSLWALALIAVTSFGAWQVFAAELGTAPRANDRQVSRVVISLLRREHLSKHPLDNEISERALKMFLKSLDNWKMYFYQSDIDEFMVRKHEIDDMIKDGDITFAYTIFQRFSQRVDERLKTIEQWIAADHDFSVQEEIVRDPDATIYPRTPAEANDRWRRRIKYDFLILRGDKVEMKEARERLLRRYNGIAKRWKQTDGDELLELYLTSITMSFDPHTTYMSPSSFTNFKISLNLQLDGIGAALQMTDGYTIVSKIIPGGAADKDGKLKPEDRVVSVGQGENGEMVDVMDMKLNDVVDKIRGKAGTIVRLGVVSPGATETKIIAITRAKIELQDSAAAGEVTEFGMKPDGSPIKIGVINLPSFYLDMDGAKKGIQDFKSTTRDVAKILEDFNKKHVDAVVLDLRANGGGSLTEAISLTGLFIDQGPVVQVKDPDGRVQHYDDLEQGMLWDGPLVVMISKFSASASEILAGAIQDYQRGIIIGDDTTHGKGTVQSLMAVNEALFRNANAVNAPNLGALKITMQQFYRPNGDSTQKRGVVADIKLPSVTNHMDVSESDLDYALEFDKVPAARFGRMNLVAPDLVGRLSAASEARKQSSAEFAKQAKKIQRYREYKSKKTTTLNEDEYRKQNEEVNAEKEDEKQIDNQLNGKSKVIPKDDFYFSEVLAVTADYVRELRAKRVVRAN